jgi:hypothetical protein
MIAALLCAAANARAEGEFALDFVHWNNTPAANAEQTLVAKTYLAGIRQINPMYVHPKVAQVICMELAQDLVSTHHFYYCQLVFEANAVDGGPFDEGSVMAWNGKAAVFHQESLDPKDAQGRVTGLQLFSASTRIVDAPLTKAVNAALTKRIASAAVTKFFLMVHHDTGHLLERPQLPLLKELQKESRGDEVDVNAYSQAVGSPHQIYAFSRGLESEIIGIRVDALPNGFAVDEAVVVVHYTRPG